jgi:hypothetical protein
MTKRASILLTSSLLLVPWLLACSSEDSTGGGSAGSSGASGAGGQPSGGTGAGTTGVAGTMTAAGSGGAAGSLAGGGAAGIAGSSSGAGGVAGSGGGSQAVPCPADATFCSGFEEAGLPAGAVYQVNAAPGEWTRDFEVDTSVFRGGASSLRVKASTDAGTSGSSYQMLAVPAPMAKFWVRFYFRQADVDIGGLGHNVFAGASDTDGPNSSVMVELAEDVGVAFNTSDSVRWPMGYGRLQAGGEMPFTLPKAMWHCIEISYDSETRHQQLFVNGAPQIDATDYPANVAAPFKFFKFGFKKLHGPARAVWYDDVAVGPTRPGCL